MMAHKTVQTILFNSFFKALRASYGESKTKVSVNVCHAFHPTFEFNYLADAECNHTEVQNQSTIL